MPSPEFPLEALARHRRRQEEERQLALASLRQQLDQERAALAALWDRFGLELDHLRGEQASITLDLAAIDASLAYLGSLRAGIDEQNRLVLDLARRCDAAREDLIRASQAVKTVERIRELWEEEQRQERLRREDKALAEVGVDQFNRRALAW